MTNKTTKSPYLIFNTYFKNAISTSSWYEELAWIWISHQTLPKKILDGLELNIKTQQQQKTLGENRSIFITSIGG